MKNHPTAPKQLARLTGLLYLIVIICAGFSQGYMRGTIVVPGDAAQTALNILEQGGLFRLGLATDLIAFTADAVIAVLFYQLFKPVNQTLSMVAAALRLLAHPAIASLNLLNHYLAQHVLESTEWALSHSPEQLYDLSLLFMDAHRAGYLIAGALFGLHCLLLGILIYRSDLIPKAFGVLMSLAGLTYLMETFGVFLFPGNDAWLALLVGGAAALGEVSLMGYLLARGVRER
ncbi:MAG: DUF4386 domain-containing protein [Phaeodactylibacter xiamenensis]|uniref:DUF4386 domain-containing protein n=1 Tax=Phaeodactylibacter xiamenensis TaxID=1524460 RepID=A0A098SB28_9BACT|nr:DUF4386 domain-containing protein [Phaeodactylibacter xiamenensis]KGE89305.1 hypothetical protein IX84_02955 [Phaeodactylibacter xiamenensis]MCR9053061.1 DUF4386 domain-containing protein [bacterium]